MPRIGLNMVRIAEYVANNPGCTKLAAADHVTPAGATRQNGYAAVDRAIAIGLVWAYRAPDAGHPVRYELYRTEKPLP